MHPGDDGVPQTDIATLLARASTFHREGKLAEAETLYRAVLARVPMQFDALHLLGLLQYQYGRHEAAVELIGRALSIKENVSSAHSNRGLALHALHRFDEALASCNRALQLDPANARAHNNRGIVLFDLGRVDLALACYDRALALQPDYAEALNNRGNALRVLKRYSECAATFARLFALDPNFPDVLGNMFFARLQCCDWSDYGQDRKSTRLNSSH